METKPSTTTPSRPLASKDTPRWLALAGTGAASLVASGNADAALVQITQSNIHVGGNFVSQSTNNFSGDFTGDGLADVPWFGPAYGFNGIGLHDANPPTPGGGVRANLIAVANFGSGGVPTPVNPGGSSNNLFFRGGVVSFGGIGNFSTTSPSPLSATGLIAVSFSDVSHGASPINALAEIAAAADGTASGTRLTITRLIFDDADPTGAALPTFATAAASYTEAGTIPEPSSLALLTLGAGGLLLRRKRKQQAA